MTTGRIENSNLPYTPIRSAFTVIDKPLRFFYDRYIPHPEGLNNLKNPYYLRATVVYPIIICAAPVTMVADVVIGVAECIFCTIVRGDSLRDVAELARKKIIVSPLHHLTFIISSLAVPALFYGYALHAIAAKTQKDPYWLVISSLIYATGLAAFWISTPLLPRGHDDVRLFPNIPAPLQLFIQNRLLNMAVQTFFVTLAIRNLAFLTFRPYTSSTSAIMHGAFLGAFFAFTAFEWTFSYTLSQRMIGSFSPSWNHEAFSIFINGGARLKWIGTRFHHDAIDLKPGMTFQDVGFTDHDITYWKHHAKRPWVQMPCPPRP